MAPIVTSNSFLTILTVVDVISHLIASGVVNPGIGFCLAAQPVRNTKDALKKGSSTPINVLNQHTPRLSPPQQEAVDTFRENGNTPSSLCLSHAMVLSHWERRCQLFDAGFTPWEIREVFAPWKRRCAEYFLYSL